MSTLLNPGFPTSVKRVPTSRSFTVGGQISSVGDSESVTRQSVWWDGDYQRRSEHLLSEKDEESREQAPPFVFVLNRGVPKVQYVWSKSRSGPGKAFGYSRSGTPQGVLCSVGTVSVGGGGKTSTN